MKETWVSQSLKELNVKRKKLFPIVHKDLWKWYIAQHENFWSSGEIDLTNDKDDWEQKLNIQERELLTRVFTFLSKVDSTINDNLITNFMNEIHIRECKNFFAIQHAIEIVHEETYEIFINELVPNVKNVNIRNDETLEGAMKVKFDWVDKWMDNKKPLEYRIFSFAILEGVMLQGTFACINWFKPRNILSGLCFANKKIATDENIHKNEYMVLITSFVRELEDKHLKNIVEEALFVEDISIDWYLETPIGDLTADSVKKYVRFLMSDFLRGIG